MPCDISQQYEWHWIVRWKRAQKNYTYNSGIITFYQQPLFLLYKIVNNIFPAHRLFSNPRGGQILSSTPYLPSVSFSSSRASQGFLSTELQPLGCYRYKKEFDFKRSSSSFLPSGAHGLFVHNTTTTHGGFVIIDLVLSWSGRRAFLVPLGTSFLVMLYFKTFYL